MNQIPIVAKCHDGAAGESPFKELLFIRGCLSYLPIQYGEYPDSRHAANRFLESGTYETIGQSEAQPVGHSHNETQ